METIKLNYGDTLTIDPCYIKHVEGERYDALKCIKVLHSGDDGEFLVKAENGEKVWLGVDSGRIWTLEAEFGVEVEIDAGLSGYKIVKKEERKTLDK